MGNFHYKAVDRNNEIVSGEIDAVDERSVFEAVHALGLYPVEVSDRNVSGILGKLDIEFHFTRGVSPAELTLFTKQMATLLEAGIEVDRALDVVLTLTDSPKLTKAITRVRDDVRNGMALADAFERHLVGTPPFYVGMVRAGELGGSLDRTFERLATLLQRLQTLRESIRSQLIYPIILLVTAGLSLILLVTVVIPQFEPIFRDAGREMPFAARSLMATARFISAYWWLLVVLGIAGALALRAQWRQPSGRLWFDTRLLALPAVGPIILRLSISRFCRTLGALLANGVAAVPALRIAVTTLGNSALVEALSPAIERVRQGQTIAAALGAGDRMPELARQLIAIGEESGRLEAMMLHAADLYDAEIERRTKGLIVLLTPIVTVLLGALVAGIISSVMLAVLSVNELAF